MTFYQFYTPLNTIYKTANFFKIYSDLWPHNKKNILNILKKKLQKLSKNLDKILLHIFQAKSGKFKLYPAQLNLLI